MSRGHLSARFIHIRSSATCRCSERERVAAGMRDVLAAPTVISALPNTGVAAHCATSDEFAVILDRQCAKWAATAQEHAIKPVPRVLSPCP